MLNFVSLVPLLMALGLSAPDDQQPQQRVRSITVEDRIIIRVPVRPPPGRVQWVARDGPKCFPTAMIRGAFYSGGDHVEFLLAGRRILRAELGEGCPALDFYEGFYLNSEDDKICAGRDTIRSRMGGTCQIERFRALRPIVRR